MNSMGPILAMDSMDFMGPNGAAPWRSTPWTSWALCVARHSIDFMGPMDSPMDSMAPCHREAGCTEGWLHQTGFWSNQVAPDKATQISNRAKLISVKASQDFRQSKSGFRTKQIRINKALSTPPSGADRTKRWKQCGSANKWPPCRKCFVDKYLSPYTNISLLPVNCARIYLLGLEIPLTLCTNISCSLWTVCKYILAWGIYLSDFKGNHDWWELFTKITWYLCLYFYCIFVLHHPRHDWEESILNCSLKCDWYLYLYYATLTMSGGNPFE